MMDFVHAAGFCLHVGGRKSKSNYFRNGDRPSSDTLVGSCCCHRQCVIADSGFMHSTTGMWLQMSSPVVPETCAVTSQPSISHECDSHLPSPPWGTMALSGIWRKRISPRSVTNTEERSGSPGCRWFCVAGSLCMLWKLGRYLRFGDYFLCCKPVNQQLAYFAH